MARYRRIPTGIRSERDIQRALTDMGLKNVEVHAAPEPLTDWIGRPTTMLASVIVRRKDLGATADDIGFARTPDGTFEMLVSEIHLFRFDRKWMAELAERTGTTVSPGNSVTISATTVKAAPKPPLITGGSVRPVAQPTISSATPPRLHVETAREPNAAQRARLEAATILDSAKKSQTLGALGCLFYFIPVLPSFLVFASPDRRGAFSALVVLWVVWTMIYFFGIAIVLTVRFQRRAREFAQRFPSASEARTAAIAHLRAVAHDQKNAAAKTAERLLKQIEASATSAITQRLPKPPRGPDE